MLTMTRNASIFFLFPVTCSGNFSLVVLFLPLIYIEQALRVAPSSAEDGGKNVVAMLYLNRAVVLYVSCAHAFLCVQRILITT